jgi:hypothetical protein
MPRVGLEHTVPVFERVRIFCTSNLAATVIGITRLITYLFVCQLSVFVQARL